MTTEMTKNKKFFTTMDILIMAVVAAIGAVLSAFVINPIVRSMQIASPFVSMWPGSLHLLSIVLGGMLIKKPGAGIATALINGLCQMLFGSASGVLCLVYGVGNGIGAELGLILFKYKPSMISTMVMAGLATMTGFFVDLIYWFGDFTFGFKVLYLVDAFFAGLVVCGLIGWGLLLALEKAGVTKLGRKAPKEEPKDVKLQE